MLKEIRETLPTQDEQVVRAAIAWLEREQGAVSANVQLPSGRSVLVHKNGRVQEAV
jgi:hypothetical protein